jgi:hypothetical protein
MRQEVAGKCEYSSPFASAAKNASADPRSTGTPRISRSLLRGMVGKGMANDKQRDALLVIGKHLKSELDRAPAEPKPDIERALRRLLERDVAERSRPHTRWSGKAK